MTIINFIKKFKESNEDIKKQLNKIRRKFMKNKHLSDAQENINISIITWTSFTSILQ